MVPHCRIRCWQSCYQSSCRKRFKLFALASCTGFFPLRAFAPLRETLCLKEQSCKPDEFHAKAPKRTMVFFVAITTLLSAALVCQKHNGSATLPPQFTR